MSGTGLTVALDGRSRRALGCLAAALALAAPAAHAGGPDTSSWKCERCPFARGGEASFTAGAVYVSDDSAAIGDATGYDEKGGYLTADGEGHRVTDDYRVGFQAEDLGLDSRVVEVAGGRPGSFDLNLSYRQLPRHQYQTTQSVFSPGPGHSLQLPDLWTPGGTTAGFADLADSLTPVDIESERRTLKIGGSVRPVPKLQMFARVERQERDGNQVQGGAYYTQSSLLPRRFDYLTNQVDAGFKYQGPAGHATLAYYGSFFNDAATAYRWESPFTTAPGAEQSALAAAPDNDFQQLALSGGYRFVRLATDASFSAAVGRGRQNDTLLPYTTNANLAPEPLPVPRLDGTVDTTNLALTLVSRPLPRARVKLALRYDERDNNTARQTWSRVVADTFLSNEPEENLPYGFRRFRLNAGAEYDWSSRLRVSGGYDRTELDRTFQEVAGQTEDSGWGRLQWRPTSYLDLSAWGGVARRETDRYDEALAVDLGQNPLLRKYNLAYRYRQFGELTATASPPDWPIALGLQASYEDLDYSGSALGITGSEELRVAADLNWSLGEKASVYLTAGFSGMDTDTTGSAAHAAPDWQAAQSDDFYSLGAGFRLTALEGKVTMRFDYTRAAGNTGINVTGGGGPAGFPDLESTLDSLRAEVEYLAGPNLTAVVQLRYESLPAEDWMLQDAAPDTLPTVLTLGARPYDDSAWTVGVAFRYRFGTTEQ